MTSAYLACLLASLQAYNLVFNQSDLVASKLIKFYANVSEQNFFSVRRGELTLLKCSS